MRRTFLYSLVFLSVIRLSAQQKGESVSDIYVSGPNDSLRYQLYVSSGLDTTKKYPLVLWLHGMGERGTDNTKQMTLIKKWLPDSLEKSNYKSILLAPQCSRDTKWNVYDKHAGHLAFDSITPAVQLNLITLINEIIQNYPVDTTRIYIIGISMGGFGVFDMITRFPDRFAAAIPICGGADPTQGEMLKKTAIWAFHGEKDGVVNKRHTIVPMEKIKDDAHKLTLYPSTGHDAWNKAFKEKDLLKWLFEQSK